MLANNLVVPVVLWGPNTPTHCVSSVFLSRDQKTLATGCYDGQICLWQMDPDSFQMTPRCLLRKNCSKSLFIDLTICSLLVGHTAPVLCLSRASIIQDNNFLVSSSESGEMCTWDLIDGKCRENIKLAQVHTNIQAYHMSNCDDIRLFCNGYYAEVMVMDPFSLEVLFCLSSKVNPDWCVNQQSFISMIDFSVLGFLHCTFCDPPSARTTWCSQSPQRELSKFGR